VHRVLNNEDRSAFFIVNFVGLPPETPTLISQPNPCRN
jgi:hypothetical protein